MIKGMKMIYLDNAATSKHKPLKVKLALLRGVTKFSANPGRAGHFVSIRTGFEVYKTREAIKKFFNADSNYDVIFTSGCTEALNLAIQGTKQAGKHIITTVNEHNSVLRTVEFLKDNYNISYSLIKPNDHGVIDVSDIKRAITSDTYMVIVNHTSNVTGATSDIEKIGKLCSDKNLLLLVDVAQSAGHEPIDIKKFNIPLIAVAGHKGLLGPQGVGCLIVSKNVKLKPIKFGGTGTNSESIIQPTDRPEGFESGTIATPNILALGEGVNYVYKNFSKINTKITQLTTYLINELKKIPKLHLYSNNPQSGVVSFDIENIDCNDIINILSEKYKICVRGGMHCAPLIHKHLNSINGLVRVSLSHKNNINQLKKLIKILLKLAQENK